MHNKLKQIFETFDKSIQTIRVLLCYQNTHKSQFPKGTIRTSRTKKKCSKMKEKKVQKNEKDPIKSQWKKFQFKSILEQD